MKTPDNELVFRTLAGEQAAFAQLVDRYRDAVCAVAYHHLGRFDDVQDAAQEAFVQAYLQLGQLHEADKFGPWLRLIAANVCKQAMRKGKPTVPLDDMEEQAACPEADPQRAAMRMVVRDALNRLTEGTRLAVTLSYINGYSHAEIGEFLDIPVNTVRSRLQHAKKKLREEMISMVTDVLHEGKPEPEFSVQVVHEALRRAQEASMAHAAGDALRHYDEALGALDKMKSSLSPRDIKRQALEYAEKMGEPSEALQELKSRKPKEVLELLRAEVLWQKGIGSAHFALGGQESLKLLEESLATTERLAYKPGRALRFEHIGVAYANADQDGHRAEDYYRKAIDAYRELGDVGGEAKCVLWLGSQRLGALEAREGRQYLEQALPLFEKAGSHEWGAVCSAWLKLLEEVGDERFPAHLGASGVCECLRSRDGVISYAWQPGFSKGGASEPALSIGNVFYQISRFRTFLDPSVPVGGSWSGDGFSFSYQPLKVTVTVESDSESVTVSAGTFEHCLLIEYVTTESDLPDDADDDRRELNRTYLCGTRRAWYARGVGLVQLHLRTGEGEALIQLREFSIAEPTNDYLPLAIGNSWVYGWANVSDEYIAKEAYRVAANADDMWYIEHYNYVLKR